MALYNLNECRAIVARTVGIPSHYKRDATRLRTSH